jgi:hypothetical protein
VSGGDVRNIVLKAALAVAFLVALAALLIAALK